MRGGYQIVDLSSVTVGAETKVDGVYKIISGFDGKPVFIITPNTSGIFAEFTENSGMYIGAYIGSNSHLFTVSIISSDRVTITDKGPAGGGGTSNYNELSNKPAIAGTTLSGDKSLADLGVQGVLTAGTNISISESNEISASVSSMAAANVTFDNTGSGMVADDVQEAITELNNKSLTFTELARGNSNSSIELNNGAKISDFDMIVFGTINNNANPTHLLGTTVISASMISSFGELINNYTTAAEVRFWYVDDTHVIMRQDPYSSSNVFYGILYGVNFA